VILSLGTAGYFAWLLLGGLNTGLLEPPGAGKPLDRDRWPKTFRFSIILCCIVIAIFLGLAVIAATGWQPLSD
jgi:hypothetical protein